jgi:hypothetical protein
VVFPGVFQEESLAALPEESPAALPEWFPV